MKLSHIVIYILSLKILISKLLNIKFRNFSYKHAVTVRPTITAFKKSIFANQNVSGGVPSSVSGSKLCI